MQTLSSLIQGVNVISIRGDKNVKINSLAVDSREVSGCNSGFTAISGHAEDGHKFIQSAIDAGACAVICERMPIQLCPEVTYVQVSFSSIKLNSNDHNSWSCNKGDK